MELKPHKLFPKVSLTLMLGVSLAFALFFIIGIDDVAKAVSPPDNAQCSTKINDNSYICKGTVPSEAALLPNLRSQTYGTCLNECINSGGISMQFTEGGKTTLYCYGATEDGTCNLFSGGIISSKEDVNVRTGEVKESCSSVNFACHIRNVLVAIKNLGQNLILAVLGIIADLLGTIFFFISKVFAWTIGALTSITVSPNHPNTVSIVKTGWEISRDIANMFFIIILSFIGLATILGIQKYEAKKLLPTLLIVALLINFSGLLVGFITDIGNLFTNFFLNKATGLEWNLSFPGDPLSSTTGVSETLGGHLARIIFYIVASIIYIAISFIFFIRVFFLWTLAILAPLAFAAFILPATKKYWNQWWEQLIQWSILSIPMAFFIYLSRLALEPTVQTSLKNIGGNTGPNPLVNFMGPFVALFLLFLGISISTSLAPSAAQGIIGGFKKYSAKAGKGLGLLAGTAAWRRMGSPLEKFGENIRKLGQGMEVSSEEQTRGERILGKIPGLTALGGNRIGRFGARALGWGIESGSRGITARLESIDAGKLNARREAAKKDGNSANSINSAVTNLRLGLMNEALGDMMGIGDNGDSDDVLAAIKNGKMNMNDISKIYKAAVQRGTPYRRQIEKMFLGEVLDKKNNRLGVSDKHREEILEKITPQDFITDLIPPDYLDSEKYENANEVLDAVMSTGGAAFMPQIMRRSEKGLRQRIWSHAKSKGDQWFIDNGAEDILHWSKSSAAAGLGLSALGSMSPNEISDRVEMRDSDISDDDIENKISELKKAILDEGAEKFKADFLGHTDTNHEAEIARLSVELGKYKEMTEVRAGKKREEAKLSEEQPITIQLARLKKESGGLESRTKMKHLPGKLAKGELKKLQTQIKELEKQQGEQSPIMRVFEDAILQDQTRVDTKVSTIAKLEKTAVNLGANQKQISADLQALSGKPASSQRVNNLRKSVQEIQHKRDEINNKVTELQEELKQDRERIAEETKRWQGLRQRPAPQKTDMELLQTNLAAVAKEETAQKTLLATLKTQKVTPEQITVAQKKLDEVRRRRRRWKKRIEDLGVTQSTSKKKPPRPSTGGPAARPAPSGPSTGPVTGGGTPPTSGDAPSATPTPPTTSSNPQSSQKPQRPRWLSQGLNDIKTKGGIPTITPERLRQYLKENGVSNSEIKKMTLLQAWQRADELSQQNN